MGVKLGLFALMACLLWRAMERAAAVGRIVRTHEEDGAATVRGLVRLYGLMVAVGGVALLMGLWLAGVS